MAFVLHSLIGFLVNMQPLISGAALGLEGQVNFCENLLKSVYQTVIYLGIISRSPKLDNWTITQYLQKTMFCSSLCIIIMVARVIDAFSQHLHLRRHVRDVLTVVFLE